MRISRPASSRRPRSPVRYQPSGSKAAAYQRQLNGTFPIVLDEKSAVYRLYGFRGIPDSVFIDRNGIVRDIVQGPISRGTLVYKLNQTMKATDTP